MNDNSRWQRISPALVLGVGDIEVIQSIIRGYLAYARRAIPPSQEREMQYHLLEGVSMQLAELRPDAPESRLLLTLSEKRALDSALRGFMVFVRQHVPPSQERDETVEDVERFRLQLARLLPAHIN